MKIKDCIFLAIAFPFLFAACKDKKETTTKETGDKVTTEAKPNKDITETTGPDITAPDFADPELRQYYALYTLYLKKVTESIQHKDEAGTMKLFTEEGKQFTGRNEMDKKAQAAETQKFNTWLMQTMPYQKIIVQSDYYKKWNEEYYKNVKEKFEKGGY